MTRFDRGDYFEIKKSLIDLYDSYGAESSKMSFAGLITMFSVLEIPVTRVKSIIYVVGRTVTGYHPDGTKIKPMAKDFEHAISSLDVNDRDVSKAIKGIVGG